jgi:hypothetical protein
MRRTVTARYAGRILALTLAVVMCGTPTTRAPVSTIAEAWAALPRSGSACGDDLAFDYALEGGVRNAFCRALLVFRWKTLLSLAPTAPFSSGPHRGGKLDLKASKQFGHYDPAFVRWAIVALVPAAKNAQLRDQTQPVYEQQFRELARTSFLVWRALSADAEWSSTERTRYAAAMARGEADEGTWGYSDVLGDAAHEWNGHDPNHVRTATMWWLHRSLDETAPLWAEGLERLLTTYDAAWLATARAGRPAPLPAHEVPEYR